jgi:hypothetical protein
MAFFKVNFNTSYSFFLRFYITKLIVLLKKSPTLLREGEPVKESALSVVIIIIIFELRTAALRLIVRSWLDVPTFATRRPHASPRESTQQWKVELWARNVL